MLIAVGADAFQFCQSILVLSLSSLQTNVRMKQTSVYSAVKERKPKSAPFTIRLLGPIKQNGANHSIDKLDPYLNLFPASYCTQSHDLASPSDNYTALIASELDIQRLNRIHRWLWVAGTAVPARSLHDQLSRGREVVITEAMDMHLVWTTGKVYIKPLPRFLLEPTVWTEYLCCQDTCKCISRLDYNNGQPMECERRKLYKVALGFLYSYAALIRHESDFLLAKDRYLLPSCGISWFNWIAFVKQLDTEHIYPDINPRFHHKELRLSRLNYIYYFTQLSPAGFLRRWDRYSTFFHMNLGWLAATTVYIVVVLTAMQVGLATETLAKNSTFQSASYGFTVFSILGPLTRRNRAQIEVLYDPEDDPVNPTKANVDVVAVHGLGSDVDRTWTWRPDDPEQSVHWLKDSDMLRRKIPNARILAYNYDSTWLYDAPRVRAESCGKALIYGLDNFREREGTRDRPIIFLAHSFGGLVIQDGLVFADSMGRFEDILRYTAGFVSLGTPFRGTDIHWAADLAANVMRLYGSYRGCLSVLKYDNPQLRYKTQCFGRLRKKYHFPMFCFFESLETTFIRLPFLGNYFKAIVVDEASACLSELARLPLETDHIKLNKYSSPEDQSYLRVSAEIVRMCNNVVAVMNRLNNGDESSSTDHGEDTSQHDEGVGHQGSQDRHLERTSPFIIKNTR
ncbi:unnamed protein product [Fusarium graminearum]|uniref:DUF676 domain-containing protein n=1 Tax=Gibberella zeae TaxID=5518 RepID=A0A9N8RC83_GIBZA|nr:unnamed protein product [Fusarium graminearum]